MTDDPATTLSLERLVAERHADAGARHAELVGRDGRHGPFVGARRGQGSEPDELRPYTVGDDVRRVDWKTSARRAALHVRLHREEREHAVTIALDLRAPMFTGSRTLRAVEAGRLAARLLWRASAGGSRVGVTTLADDGVAGVRATGGERGALAGCGHVAAVFARARRRSEGELATDGGTATVGEEASAGARGSARTGRTADRVSSLVSLFEALIDGGRALGTVLVVTGLDGTDTAGASGLTRTAGIDTTAGSDAPATTRAAAAGTTGTAFEVALIRLAAVRPLAVVRVEDPLERAPPPPGRYRYRTADGTTTIRLGHRERRSLERALAARHETLERRFARAAVPLLSTRDGLDEVPRALRARGLLS